MNGPPLVTKVLERYCNVTVLKAYMFCPRAHVTIQPHTTFSPIDWGFQQRLFALDNDEKQTPAASNNLLESLEKESYVVHYWNDLSNAFAIDLTSKHQPLANLARKHCPITVKNSGDALWGFRDSGKGATT